MPDAPALPASPLHALCVYAEPLVVGRRVVLFGDARRGLGERLLELGARAVRIYDPEPARGAEASARAIRGLTVQALPTGEFDVRDGAFDVAIVPDIRDVASAGALLARVRRLLAPEGAVLVRSPTPDATLREGPRHAEGSLDYYELYDLVALQFEHVRMVGQLPWSGVALAELGNASDDPDVTVDTQLVSGEPSPEAFIAVGSQEALALAAYSLVQLPASRAHFTEASGSERSDLAAAQLRASLLEAQIEEVRAQRNIEGGSHAQVVGSLEAELAARLSELEQAESRALDATTRAERTIRELRAREEEVARLGDRVALVQKELEDERRQRSRAELELSSSRNAAAAASTDARDAAVALEGLSVLETAAAELNACVVDLTGRLAASEEARRRAESALAEERAACADRVPDDRAAARTEGAEARVAELETAVVLLEQEIAALGQGHGDELVLVEQALRERARENHALERELARRERIVLDLVHALEEARVADAAAVREGSRERAGQAVDADGLQKRADQLEVENEELRMKLDAAAMDVARREGDGATSAWRIQELEEKVARLEDEQSELTMTIPPPAFLRAEHEANDVTRLTERLSAAEDELDMLRQALAQEHEARARVESGEALQRANEELQRQAALLEKLSLELEARDGVRRTGAPDDSSRGTA